MHFPSRLLAMCLSGLALTTVASPVVDLEDRAAKKDNSAAVIKDISAISTDLTALNNTLNTFQPDALLGLITALQIQQETNTLATQINDTIADVTSSKKFSSSESYNIAFATLNLIAPINSTIQNIVAHKPAFASVDYLFDLSQTVEQSLVEQQQLTQELGNALAKKLSSPYNTLAPQVTAELVGIFTAAIKKYKTCSGVLCLPPIST